MSERTISHHAGGAAGCPGAGHPGHGGPRLAGVSGRDRRAAGRRATEPHAAAGRAEVPA